MKANAAKKKIFNDAVDMLIGDAPMVAPENGIQMLAVDSIKPFYNHPFRLYEGERLDDMVESVREHGILNPVIVRAVSGGYEMLAGHNRQNAARLAGLVAIPAIVKEDLPDAEAYVYVIETNVMQRSFNDFSVSERIAVLAERYDKVCGTRKRDEILAELQQLNGGGGHHVHQQAKSRELIGQEYGMTGRNIARYIRCNQLIQPFKEMMDDGSLSMVSAVELSYLPETDQVIVKKVMDQNCIKLKTNKAGELRKAAGNLSEEKAKKILDVDRLIKMSDAAKTVSVKLSAKLYGKYFSDVAAKDVQGILEEALELYFEKKGV